MWPKSGSHLFLGDHPRGLSTCPPSNQVKFVWGSNRFVSRQICFKAQEVKVLVVLNRLELNIFDSKSSKFPELDLAFRFHQPPPALGVRAGGCRASRSVATRRWGWPRICWARTSGASWSGARCCCRTPSFGWFGGFPQVTLCVFIWLI